MTTHVRPAEPPDFPLLFERFFRPMNERIGRDKWRRLFDHDWSGGGEPPGQILMDQERVVGFVGLLHAQVPRPDGASTGLCNITTWVVDPGYEDRSLALVMPILSRKDLTLTNLTSRPSVHAIFSRLGFRELDAAVCVLRPTPLARSRWGRPKVHVDLETIVPHLPAWERRIAEDHRPYGHHLLLRESGGRHCYVVYTLGVRRRLRTARIHWATPGVLSDCSVALQRALFRVSRALLTEMDHRLAPDGLPGAIKVHLKVPRLFRSAQLDPAEVPNVYSEMVLLEVW